MLIWADKGDSSHLAPSAMEPPTRSTKRGFGCCWTTLQRRRSFHQIYSYTLKLIATQALLSVNPWLIHRNQECFGPDAGIYNPERWLGDAEELRKMEKFLIPVSTLSLLSKASISPTNYAYSLAWATTPAQAVMWPTLS